MSGLDAVTYDVGQDPNSVTVKKNTDNTYSDSSSMLTNKIFIDNFRERYNHTSYSICDKDILKFGSLGYIVPTFVPLERFDIKVQEFIISQLPLKRKKYYPKFTTQIWPPLRFNDRPESIDNNHC